jgi:hypothetical protein
MNGQNWFLIQKIDWKMTTKQAKNELERIVPLILFNSMVIGLAG